MSESLFAEFNPSNYREWKSAVEKELKGQDYESQLLIEVEEGIVVEPLYTSETQSTSNEKPNTAIRSECANEQIIDLKIGIQKANEKALRVLNAGVNAITFSGRVSSYADFKNLLQNIGVPFIQLAFIRAENYTDLAQFLIQLVKENNWDKNNIRGYFGIDPIGDLFSHGKWNQDEESDFKTGIEVSKLIAEELPQFRSLTVSASLLHNAGADFSEEIAVSTAIGIEYIDRLSKAGISLDRCVRLVQINTAAGPELLHELAKFRAMRMLWSRVVSAYPNQTLKNLPYFRGETSVLYSSALDAHTNLLRASTEVFAMMNANLNGILVLPYNEAEPEEENEFAERIARNIFLILRDEAYLERTLDPSAGAYFIEELSNQLLKKSFYLLNEIENSKGILALFFSGKLKNAVDQQYERKKSDFLKGKLTMVGTNKYTLPAEPSPVHKTQANGTAIIPKRLSDEWVNAKAEVKS